MCACLRESQPRRRRRIPHQHMAVLTARRAQFALRPFAVALAQFGPHITRADMQDEFRRRAQRSIERRRWHCSSPQRHLHSGGAQRSIRPVHDLPKRAARPRLRNHRAPVRNRRRARAVRGNIRAEPIRNRCSVSTQRARQLHRSRRRGRRNRLALHRRLQRRLTRVSPLHGRRSILGIATRHWRRAW